MKKKFSAMQKFNDLDHTTADDPNKKQLDQVLNNHFHRQNSYSDNPKKLKNKMMPDGDCKQTQKKLYRICLTGGQCAGVTSALLHIKQAMDKQNALTIIVPDCFKLLQSNLLSFTTFKDQNLTHTYQMGRLRAQIALEGIMMEMARELQKKEGFTKDILVICNRGCMDGSAFMDTEEFISMIESQHWSISMLRDNRYDMVIHLNSAAKGAEKYFTLPEKVVNAEDIEAAVLLDDKVQNAYLGHPRVKVVTNREDQDFEDKLNHCVRLVMQMFNYEVKDKAKTFKYLLEVPPSDDNGIPLLDKYKISFEQFLTDEVYLSVPQGSSTIWSKIKHRYSLKSHCYSLHSKAENNQVKRLITAKIYFEYLKTLKSPAHCKIKLVQQVFYTNGDVYKLKTFMKDGKVIYVLRVATENDTEPELPEFLKVHSVIKNSTTFKSYEISKIDHTFDANQPYVKIIQNTAFWKDSNKGFLY